MKKFARISLILVISFAFVALSTATIYAQEADNTSAGATAAEDGSANDSASVKEAEAADEELIEAEEEAATSAEAEQDEEVTAADLGVEEPTLLPTSPFYFAKSWWQTIRVATTFNPIKKAELQLRYANQKLIEAQKVSEKTGNEEIAAKAVERYQKTVEKAGDRIEKIKEKSKDNPRFQKLVDRFTDNGFKHHRLIEKLKKRYENAPEEVQEKIQAARAKAVEKLGEVLNEVDGEKADERLEKIMSKIKGSRFKPMKNLEVLKALEDKLPEQALPAIKRAQANALKRLKHNIEELSPEERKDKFGRYLIKTTGNAVRHLEILEDLKSREDVSEGILDVIEAVKGRPLRRIERKLKKLKNDKAKEQYLEDLKDGKVEKMKVLNMIENNIDPDEAKKLHTIKNAAVLRFKDRIQNPEIRERILEKLQSADVGQFEVIEELEDKLPEDKKDFIKKMRERAFDSVNNKLDAIKDANKREHYLRRIAGDDPKQIEILKRVQEKIRAHSPAKARAVGALDKVIRKQNERIENRIENIKDKAHLERLRGKIEASPALKSKFLHRIKAREGAVMEHQKELKEKFKDHFKLRRDNIKDNLKDRRDNIKDNVKERRGNIQDNIQERRDNIKNNIKEGRDNIQDKDRQKICTEEYSPVCGANGKTYSNACQAKAAGATIKYRGKCKNAVNGLQHTKQPAPKPATGHNTAQ